VTPTDPVLTPLGDSLWVVWPERGTLEFARVAEHSDSLSAEVTVVSVAAGELSWSRLNLASAQSRAGLARLLEERDPGQDWRAMLDRSCRLVARHLRAGEPAVALVPAPPPAAHWLVEGLVPAGQLSVVFGDGGVGKSYLALALALAGLLARPLSARWRVAPLRRVLYLDWESGRDEQQARLWRLTRGLGSTPVDGALLHRTMRRPLLDDLPALRAEVAREHVDLVIADSLAPACGPEPETASAVVPALLGLRSLAVTVLILAHVSKQTADVRAPGRPFGSVFVQNLARSTIEARRSEATGEGEPGYTLTLYHRKANEGEMLRPSALDFRWTDPGTLTVRAGQAEMGWASLPQQVLDALRTPKTARQLAEELEVTPASAKKTLQRLEKRDNVIRLSGTDGGRGNEQLWARTDRKRDMDGAQPGHTREPGEDDPPF